MSRRAAAALVMALAALVPLASAAAQQQFELSRSEKKREQERIRRADPAKVIATELAFARAAQEKGQWTAFAEFAADDAVMFVPQPVNAKEWLKKQNNPPQAVRWQPHQVWSSCDGTLAVTKGAWQRPNGTVGYFTTVWRRDRDGTYEWIMDQGDGLAQPLAAPEMIGSKVADCYSAIDPLPADTPSRPGAPAGQSRDGTLAWTVLVETDGARAVDVRYWDGKAWQTAISERVAAE